MDSKKIRQQFFDFFQSKDHKIVPSAPIVNKNDPTLMFTNAGMNQFKDYFLGNQTPPHTRLADTQKCLRVSGKHNDLEEVGVDSYHHTMFEMLGNWSFGDYFKKEAIAWAWELLTAVYGLDKERLYVTVFGGDESEDLDVDQEAVAFWKEWVPEERILFFGKKDNFWEMGDTGPCGPCSEIHIDLRSDEDRAARSAADLVNKDDPRVIEIWNLVFIQYNRKQDGSLELLPAKHVDTGMGFERLCMSLQGKTSNYDTDLFTPFISFIEKETGVSYGSSYASDAKSDMAMRVIADHVRAVCFTVADGAMPSNTGAGYVIRRILRRAVRYYYSFLDRKMPLLHLLVPLVADLFEETFPEVKQQLAFLTKVILEEERSFLRTLEAGLKRLESLNTGDAKVSGQDAFELYDTFGFPIDLTRLIAAENGWSVDEQGFEKALQEQRDRSKADAKKEVGDWTIVMPDEESVFVGYDTLSLSNVHVIKYRTVKVKDKDQLQLVLDRTPFYGESGGQVGDTGVLLQGDVKIKVLDTVKENDLIIHLVDRWPSAFDMPLQAKVDENKRHLTENNHTATHLLHAALRRTLGEHVTQKGSLVNDKYLRFDFSHFQKMTDEEIRIVEGIVNDRIRQNIQRKEDRDIPISEAKESGATMLFGEKYGDEVRMITFDPQYSIELCGGCHVPATGNIGLFKIVSESAIAAGVRRIEAVTAEGAEAYLRGELDELEAVRKQFKNASKVVDQIAALQEENKLLQKKIEKLQLAEVAKIRKQLKDQIKEVDGIQFLAAEVENQDGKSLKTLIFQLENELDNAFLVLGTVSNGKPQLMVAISKDLSSKSDLHAGNIVRELAKEIQGGGGGQPFFASAGGKNPDGLKNAIEKAASYL